MEPAALYARVSTDRQADEGLSIPAQLKELRTYAQQHGQTVQEFRKILEEGALAERKHVLRMLIHRIEVDWPELCVELKMGDVEGERVVVLFEEIPVIPSRNELEAMNRDALRSLAQRVRRYREETAILSRELGNWRKAKLINWLDERRSP
jgi:hypothetical protein